MPRASTKVAPCFQGQALREPLATSNHWSSSSQRIVITGYRHLFTGDGESGSVDARHGQRLGPESIGHRGYRSHSPNGRTAVQFRGDKTWNPLGLVTLAKN